MREAILRISRSRLKSGGTFGGARRFIFQSQFLMKLIPVLITVATLWPSALRLDAGAPPRPNILIFLCDDTGWGETGFQGATDIPTPNIDSIARNGVRFTQGYVSGPYCSPTRAGLMTGRYQTRFGHEFNSAASGPRGLSLQETPLPLRFKPLGYQTCAIGKWHLGSAPEFHPVQRGFDEFYGTLANTPFFKPTQFIDSRVSPEVQPPADPDFYTTDAYAERAVDWLERSKAAPWLLYVPFNAQHAPLQAPEKYLARFPDISDEKRRLFSAMMSAMDDAVGRILGKVRELGQEENTLIWFLSDNGGPTQSTTSRNGPLHGFKAQTWEGGVRVPFCVQWKGHLPAGTTYPHPIIQLDILPTSLAAAGVTADPAWKLDGVNLLPHLTGENSARPHDTLYWRFGDQMAVLHGDLKLVKATGGGPTPELYDLSKDIGESRNLATESPEQADKLQALWEEWNAQQAPAISSKGDGKAKRGKKAAKKQNANR
jgi:arylsulfatase A-like enzyme